MEGIPWKNMFSYTLTLLAALTLLLGPSAVGEQQQSNVVDVSVSEGSQEISFNEDNLRTVVSGNVSRPEGFDLAVVSANYSEEKGLMEVSLGNNGEVIDNSSLEQVNYTLEAEFRRDIPSEVVVYGPLGNSTVFQ